MLSIFHTGGLTLALTLVFAVLETIFVVQAVKHSKAEGYSVLKSPFIYLAAAVLGAYIFAMIQVASDYHGV